jgi:Kef-type K+ transport system membrane component KefB
MQTHLLEDIGKSIIAAGALGVPAYYLRIPLILAYIAAGILIGPNLGFGFIRDHESIAGISEIGLVLLMFILGLEINLKKLLEMGKSVLITGVVQIFGTLLISSFFFYFFFFHQFSFPLIYVSVALTLSSTLIVIKILSETMDLDSLPSRMTLGLLILQDFFAVAFLAIQPDLSNIHFFSILSSAARVLSIVAGSMLLAKYILPALFKAVSKHSELLLILAMGWCFTMCGIANALHLSMEMGALIAGISIASFPYHLDVAAKIISVRDFFITLFFVSLGLTIPIPTAYSIELALLMSFAVFLTRFLTVFTSLHRLGFANRASLLASINLSQISEFSLVLASLGIKYKHIGEEILVSFILALILSALISSFLIPKAHALYKKINPFLISIGFSDSLSIKEKKEDATAIGTIVMLGFYKDSSSLLVEMQKNLSAEILKELVVIDFNPEANALLKNNNIKTFFGDVSNPDTLKMLHIDKAEMIICTLPDRILKGTTNLRLLSQLKKIAPKAKFIMSSESIEIAQKLYAHGASYVYIPRIIGAEVLFQTLQKLKIDGEEQIKTASLNHLEQRNEIIP